MSLFEDYYINKKLFQEAMFIRLQEFHFINAPSFMDKVLMMYRPFMKKKLLDMIKVHQTNADSLDKVVDKSILTKELGGNYKDCTTLRGNRHK